MCGICGYKTTGAAIDMAVLRAMCDTLRHRGPDDDGFYSRPGVGLGMRRLSIIDVPGGHQPIHNETEIVWVVFNGEIYNFRELRLELETKGHRFQTRTDTEVIVHAYEEYGADCVHQFNGMFAFALWDETRQRLFLARDRLGIKPLYYAHVNGQFVFGSEIKALLQHPAVSRELDLEALDQYLTYEYVPAPRSIFRQIRKLEPGHRLTLDGERLEDRTYWAVRFQPERFAGRSEEDLKDELAARLRESVRKRLVSDVPLGAFLSGGIDSSSVVALMRELVPDRVQTFSIAFNEPSFDESQYAHAVARNFNIVHHQEILTPQHVFDLIPQVASFLDEPLGDGSIFPTFLLCKFARQHVTVALSGDGGDELFAGYPTYIAHKFARHYARIPRLLREGIIRPLLNLLPVSMANFSFDFRVKKFVQGIPYPPPVRNLVWLGSFAPEEKQALLSPEARARLAAANCFDRLDSLMASHGPRLDGLDEILFLDMQTYMQDDILVKVDRASMANSLEVRVPFLDYEFVEFVTSLPTSLKLKGTRTKHILKKAMEGRLPTDIIARKKKGFGMPFAVWIQRELRPLVLDVLSESSLCAQGLFDAAYVQRLLQDHCENRRDNRKPILTLVMFELWARQYRPTL